MIKKFVGVLWILAAIPGIFFAWGALVFTDVPWGVTPPPKSLFDIMAIILACVFPFSCLIAAYAAFMPLEKRLSNILLAAPLVIICVTLILAFIS